MQWEMVNGIIAGGSHQRTCRSSGQIQNNSSQGDVANYNPFRDIRGSGRTQTAQCGSRPCRLPFLSGKGLHSLHPYGDLELSEGFGLLINGDSTITWHDLQYPTRKLISQLQQAHRNFIA
jgi:hypothetical protein